MAIPVSLEDAKRQLRIDLDDASRDAEVMDSLADAIGWVETYTGHILEARDVTETFRGSRPVEIKAWPIAPAATPAVTYSGPDGIPLTLLGAQLDATQRPARVRPSSGQFWPFRINDQLFAVTVRAGYETSAAVPRNMRRAILVMVSGFDADREGGEVFGAAEKTARRLCADFRRRSL